MKTTMKKFASIAIMITLILAVTTTSCKKKGDAPALPPTSAFAMDFTDFNEADTTKSYSNWGYSAANVLVWNVVLTLNLAVPVASYYEAFNHKAKYNRKEESWEWKYDFTVVVKHSAKLVGKVNGDEVKWEMYISKDGSFDDFLWYEGTSKADRTSGNWTLYATPTDPTPYLQIDWNRNESAGTSDIKYTNIVPGHADNGGFIQYGITSGSDFNRFYDITIPSTTADIDIEWHKDNANGRVTSEKQYGDTDWHCWDNTLQDAVCN